MATQFSQELIEECKKVFREEDGVELSDEEAQEALTNLSGLFLAFVKDRPNGVTSPVQPEPNNPDGVVH